MAADIRYRLFNGTSNVVLASGGTVYIHRGAGNTDATTTPLVRPVSASGETHTYSFEKAVIAYVNGGTGWTSLSSLAIKCSTATIGANLTTSNSPGFGLLYKFSATDPSVVNPVLISSTTSTPGGGYSSGTTLGTTGVTWSGAAAHTTGVSNWNGAEWFWGILRVPQGTDGGTITTFNIIMTWVEV